MDAVQWRRAFSVFSAAIACDVDERERYLTDACVGDPAMRDAVDRLVRAHESAGDFLEVPAAVGFVADHRANAGAADGGTDGLSAFAGTERFTVLRQLGAGGMGVV